MKNMNDNSAIHCMPCGPHRGFGWGGGGGGGRAKLPVEGVLKPVHGKITVCSLPHACLAAGLLGKVGKRKPVNVLILRKMAEKKWNRSLERFLSDAAGLGINQEVADQKVTELAAGAVIGWSGDGAAGAQLSRESFGVCPDLLITLGVLAHRVADIFMSWRPGDYGWDTLFGSAFEMDADLFEAPTLHDQPWSQYKWELNGTT